MARKTAPNIVYIVGTGTIGEPLIRTLARIRKEIGIDEVWFHKNTPLRKNLFKIKSIVEKDGAVLVVDKNQFSKFKEAGYDPQVVSAEARKAATVIIDCTPIGHKLKKRYYERTFDIHGSKLKGCIGQGNAKDFGKPYAFGINDPSLIFGEDRFIKVVSCGTHNILRILWGIVLDYEGADNLEYASFAIARRASDMSEEDGILEMQAKPDGHEDYGIHQAQDAALVLKTIGLHPKISGSTVDAPTQYMHTGMFDLALKKPIRIETVLERLWHDPLVAITYIEGSGEIVARARDENKAPCGRILNQTVIYEPSLGVKFGNHVKGTYFTPQDGNALLSSIAATLWFLDHETYAAKTKMVCDRFLYKGI